MEHFLRVFRLANNVLDYANKSEKVTFKVKYAFANPSASYVSAPFNPFTTIGKEIGREVHLTNYALTPMADMTWFEKNTHDLSNPASGLFYITCENIFAKPGEDKGQQLPFAVNIVFDSSTEGPA